VSRRNRKHAADEPEFAEQPENTSDAANALAEDDEKFISKSEAKRRSIALQKVGEELVALSRETLNKFNLPEALLEAILDAKRINPNKHGGMSRQMQFIGKRMREVDAAPIVAKLEELRAPTKKQNALNHLAEQWRVRLLADPTAAGAFRKEYMPDADETAPDELGSLIVKAKEEHAKGAPPKYFRLLFKFLHKYITTRAASDAA
jgi:ribosome-associated protein